MIIHGDYPQCRHRLNLFGRKGSFVRQTRAAGRADRARLESQAAQRVQRRRVGSLRERRRSGSAAGGGPQRKLLRVGKHGLLPQPRRVR